MITGIEVFKCTKGSYNVKGWPIQISPKYEIFQIVKNPKEVLKIAHFYISMSIGLLDGRIPTNLCILSIAIIATLLCAVYSMVDLVFFNPSRNEITVRRG